MAAHGGEGKNQQGGYERERKKEKRRVQAWAALGSSGTGQGGARQGRRAAATSTGTWCSTLRLGFQPSRHIVTYWAWTASPSTNLGGSPCAQQCPNQTET
jgi:hypothetical protein